MKGAYQPHPLRTARVIIVLSKVYRTLSDYNFVTMTATSNADQCQLSYDSRWMQQQPQLSRPSWPRPNRRACHPVTQLRSSPFLYTWIMVTELSLPSKLTLGTWCYETGEPSLFSLSHFTWIPWKMIFPWTHRYPVLLDKRTFPWCYGMEDPNPLHRVGNSCKQCKHACKWKTLYESLRCWKI
jgi:hypothetical protein